MPYIKQERRVVLDPLLERLAEQIESRGDLNYCITALLSSQVKQVGYAALESALGTLEAAKLEFYRRVAAPYEDIKIVENGDVYFATPMEAEPPKKGRRKDVRLGDASAVAP